MVHVISQLAEWQYDMLRLWLLPSGIVVVLFRNIQEHSGTCAAWTEERILKSQFLRNLWDSISSGTVYICTLFSPFPVRHMYTLRVPGASSPCTGRCLLLYRCLYAWGHARWSWRACSPRWFDNICCSYSELPPSRGDTVLGREWWRCTRDTGICAVRRDQRDRDYSPCCQISVSLWVSWRWAFHSGVVLWLTPTIQCSTKTRASRCPLCSSSTDPVLLSQQVHDTHQSVVKDSQMPHGTHLYSPGSAERWIRSASCSPRRQSGTKSMYTFIIAKYTSTLLVTLLALTARGSTLDVRFWRL